MSFKPVDFQVMIPKTSEVSRIQNDAHFKSSALQQQISASEQVRTEHNLKQIYSQEKAQDVHISERQGRNSRGGSEKDGSRRESKYGKDGQKADNRQNDGLQTSTIDIKI